MHIIIPMSGQGKRFLAAGYTEPKPLIVIDDKPIIEHVCDLFPGEDKITFICNEQHLNTTAMLKTLTRIRPAARIVSIKNHKKGPVFAVSQVFDMIDDEEEVIVNYCDFSVHWQYHDFLTHTRTRNADGAIPAYRNFHPHMLGSTNYAFMQEKNQWMTAIQEKQPFTHERMKEYASSGTYYFKHGRFVKKYFQRLMDLKRDLNGEYYVSMVYSLLHEDNFKISIYEIQHMLQWGTPEDVAEYNSWSDYFARLIEQPKRSKHISSHRINLMPLAGKGSRFQQEGYVLPKPLIPVSGKPMLIQAANALPYANEWRFVCLREHLESYSLAEQIKSHAPHATITSLDTITAGQAISCAAGLKNFSNDASLFIGACDNSMFFDETLFEDLAQNPDVDGIVFTFKNHPSVKRHPEMYGFVSIDSHDIIQTVSVKIPLSSQPEKDHAIVGAFYFKNVSLFFEGLNQLTIKNNRINGEFYVDSLVQELVSSGFHFKVLPVLHYISWGTPNDLRTFEYWQSYFHKAAHHPYRLEHDRHVAAQAVFDLDQRYHQFNQEYS